MTYTRKLDITSSYPTSIAILNVSKETTIAEIISVSGKDEYTTRMQGLNITGGATNAMEVCRVMLDLPNTDSLLKAFEEDLLAGEIDRIHHEAITVE
ncbi:MAG: hypothetical protein M0R77_01030 [Gammaproteobacteria bacterium]|nr:hypothetical protein [Acholeplasmataceae bacterium]MCK9529139.1 hypothetical protein [Gammaproteobacteria bacterium]